MRNRLRRHLKGKKVLVIFLLTNLVYLFMVFITIPRVMTYSNGMDLFDMMPFGYSVDYANTLLGSLGPDGRDAYLFSQLPLDMVYPLLFGLTYSLLIAYYFHKLKWFDKPIFYLSLLPILAGGFDYLENIGIITMLTGYPDVSSFIIKLTNLVTISKSILSTISFILLITLLVVFVFRSAKSRQRIR